jgi:hypothetical protein
MAEFRDKMTNFSLSRHYLTAEIGAKFGWRVAVRSRRLWKLPQPAHR